VERQWTRSGRVISEEISVRRDGARPDGIKSADYNAFLSDLFAPNLAPISFFDAERLDAMSSVEGGENLLGATMRRLLGLDVVERLREDLDIYTFRQGGRELEPLRQIVFDRQQELARAKGELSDTQSQVAAVEERLKDIVDRIEGYEAQLSSSGGTYAQRRPQLLERREAISAGIERLEREVQEMCEELLPFALAPALCRQLERRLSFEAQNAQNRLLHTFWQSQMASVQALLGDEPASPLSDKLVATLQASEPQTSGEAPVHLISDLEREKLRGWLSQVADEVPRSATLLTSELSALRLELREVEKDLERSPEDDALAPIHEAIAGLQGEKLAAERTREALTAALGALSFGCAEKQRVYDRAVEEFITAQKTRQKLALAERSKVALRVYKDALTRNQLARLETLVTENFNALCQKERLLRSVSIDAETFALRAQDAAGRTLGLSDFSAGERQLYSLALLWALRQISQRELPLLIDTPLGRLDEAHRDRLLDVFFPDVARQVLIFTTTAEVNASILSHLEPRLARHYALQFDADQEETTVTSVPVPASITMHLKSPDGRRFVSTIPIEAGGAR
jgi:DNA sulfur modification protein DndD